MSSARSILTIALTLLLAPATALAAPDWTPSSAFTVPGNAYGGQVQTRYQAGGVATEAFLEVQSLAPLQTSLHLGTVAPGGSYADQFTLPSVEGAIPTGAEIAVAPNGAAVAMWAELTGPNLETSPYRYRAAYRPAGSSTWEAPVTIATDSERKAAVYAYMTPAIGADGTAAVGLQHAALGDPKAGQDEDRYRLDVAVHPAGGPWQAATRISATSQSGEGLALGVDAQGDVTAAYTLRWNEGGSKETSDDSYTLIVRRRPASSGVWGPVEDITGSEIGWTADAQHLGENESGDAVLTYQYVRKAPQSLDVWAVTRQGPNGSWTTPAHVVNGSSAPEDAGVAPDGKAYVIYSYQGTSSAESCAGIVRAQAGGAFSAQRCLSPPNEDTFSGSLAFLGNDAYAAWRGNVPGEQNNASVQAARWADGASLPDVARDLDVEGLSYGSPTLLPDYQGSVVAFYASPTNQPRVAAYDGGAPILRAASVPASATVGQPVSVSASFVDLWSGLGANQPTWSFGDGSASAIGATAGHTYAVPGTYTITLSAADAFGNATSSSYSIVVAASASAGPNPSPTTDVLAPKLSLNLPSCAKKLSKAGCKRLQASRKAWQTLSGKVSDPAPSSGIASVQVAIYLTSGKRIEGLAGSRFRRTTKTKARKGYVAAKLGGERWSLRLPKLKAGSYTILVKATDRAGHVATTSKTVRLT